MFCKHSPRSGRKRIGAMLCAVMLVSACVSAFPGVQAAETRSIEEIQADINAYNKQNQQLRNKMAELYSDNDKIDEYVDSMNVTIQSIADEKALFEEKIAALDIQLEDLNAEITACEEEISRLNSEIDGLETEIAARQEEIDGTYEQFMRRMRAIYMAGEESPLVLLLQSENLADYMFRSEMAERIAGRDRELVEELRGALNENESAKRQLETARADSGAKLEEQNSAKEQLEVARAEEQTAQDELEARITELAGLRAAQQDMKAKNELEIAQANEQILENTQNELKDLKDELAAARAALGLDDGETPSNPGGTSSVAPAEKPKDNGSIQLGWPLPGFDRKQNITSGYGWRYIFGSNSFHTGVDIAGYSRSGTYVYRATIVAAEDGYVTIAKNDNAWNYGWGRYVAIDHGKDRGGTNWTTMYGHCSEVIVRVGQYVTKGTPIAYVGSTGNSTGNHLHFEVRLNGSTTNPLNYFTLG